MIRWISFSLALTLLLSNVEACPFASGHHKPQKSRLKEVPRVKLNTKEIKASFNQVPVRALISLKTLLKKDPFVFEEALSRVEEELQSSNSSLQKKGISSVQKCLKILEKDESLLTKNDYQTLLKHQRCAAQLLEGELYSKELIEHLSFLHFQVNLNEGYALFFKALPKEYQEISTSQFNLREFNKQIAYQIYPIHSPSFLVPQINRKIRKSFFMNWDPAMHSVRSKLATFQFDNREVSVLRMGCPIFGANIKAQIDPLFTSYLSALKVRGQKHLYFNNQNTMKKGWEKKASILLEKLSSDSCFDSTLYLVSLPYDSSFYKQRNQGRLLANQFIKSFKKHILESKQGFKFPKQILEDSSFEGDLESLFTKIHTQYFNDDLYLEQLERTQFIDLAYAHLARYLIGKLEVDFVNWTCKHGIDRAMTSLAIFEGLLRSEDQLPMNLKQSLFITYWPALAYYRRPPRLNRVVRAFSALRRFEDLIDGESCPQRASKYEFSFE